MSIHYYQIYKYPAHEDCSNRIINPFSNYSYIYKKIIIILAGEDYRDAENHSIVFTTSDTERCYNISIIDDQTLEPNQTFIFPL